MKRLWILSAILLATVSFVSVTFAADPADKPSPGIHHADRFEEKAKIVAGGDIDFILIGDSITHFWDGQGQGVQEKYFGEWKRVNLGLGWNGTQHLLWELENIQADKISPKAIMLMIGTNNIGWLGQTPDEAVAGTKAVLDKMRSLWPNAKILLLAVFPRDANERGKNRIKVNAINEKTPAFADGKHIFFLNINDKFLDENKVLSKDLFPDLLHPNAKGYTLWAEAVKPTLAEWMK